MKHLAAKDIMTSPVIAVRASDPLPDVIRTMRRHGISGVPVLDHFGLMIGIVSEGDLLKKEAGPGGLSELSYIGRPFGDNPVDTYAVGACAEEIMSPRVVSATEDTPVRQVATLMVRHEINRVPIVKGEDLVGIVTRADILTLFAASPGELLAAARAVLSEVLRMDPNHFDIIVIDGVIQIRGEVPKPGDATLIATFLGQIDGVSAVDAGRLTLAPSRAPG